MLVNKYIRLYLLLHKFADLLNFSLMKIIYMTANKEFKKKMPASVKRDTGISLYLIIVFYALTMQSTGQTDTHC